MGALGEAVTVATIAQASNAEFYLEGQRSYRHPNEYVSAGEDPDCVWWNPSGTVRGGGVNGVGLWANEAAHWNGCHTQLSDG